MEVARQVAQLLSKETGVVSVFCKPDCADTVCAYGIIKLLMFHFCREMIGYTDCISDEILLHNLHNAQEKDSKVFLLINCWRRRIDLERLKLQKDVKVVIMDCKSGQRAIPRVHAKEPYLLGGTEEEVLRQLYDRSARMNLPCVKYHGTPASVSAYQICLSTSPSFQHPNALWRAIVGCSDLFKRKLIHEDQYLTIHERFKDELEVRETSSVISPCNETCLNFFHQSSLWDALHMSPHLFEKLNEEGFQDFVANALGFPQHIAEYAYYQFITGPGKDIWSKLQSSGNTIGVQDFVIPGFQRTTINGFQIHSMDHALAVNGSYLKTSTPHEIHELLLVALSVLRACQYQEESIQVDPVFKGAEQVLGKPEIQVPIYVKNFRSEWEKKRQKGQIESITN